MSREGKAFEKLMKAKKREEYGLDFKGVKVDHQGPSHLWPNEFANDPTFRRFKGDSRAQRIKDPKKNGRSLAAGAEPKKQSTKKR